MAPEEALKAPSRLLLALEGRAWFELASFLPALPVLRSTPRGDGHPVLVLPGFLAGDRSTLPLRWFLRERGYHAHAWRLGTNFGPSEERVAGLVRRFEELRRRHGRKVTLIGWSLGGIYARELARNRADDVRQVITLASPFRSLSASNVPRIPGTGRVARSLGRRREVEERLGEPISVPSTAIWSRSDGIVAGLSCVERPGPLRESIEVQSSHCGIGFHPAALLVIADRLAQREGEWRPFDPDGFSRWPFFRAAPSSRHVG